VIGNRIEELSQRHDVCASILHQAKFIIGLPRIVQYVNGRHPDCVTLPHGDAHAGNILCLRDGSIRIVDFAVATRGSAGLDIGALMLIVPLEKNDQALKYYWER